jgi:hypothetical protein
MKANRQRSRKGVRSFPAQCPLPLKRDDFKSKRDCALAYDAVGFVLGLAGSTTRLGSAIAGIPNRLRKFMILVSQQQLPAHLGEARAAIFPVEQVEYG